ncbi:unnamed protein product [Ectocarpus sp. 6 AP-2014]
MSYRPTVVARGEPIRLTDINGTSGVRSEAAWWWEAGPVSSCCCCFPLRVGVGILAMVHFLACANLEIIILGSANSLSKGSGEISNILRPSPLTNAEQMWDVDDNARVSTQVLLFFLYVEAAVGMICSAIGLWGVFASSARAAEWYLWTWLLRFLFELGMPVKWPVAHTFLYPLRLFLYSSKLFWLLYHVKVVWSYQEVLKRRIYHAPPSGSGSARNVGGDVELNASRRGDDPGPSTYLV